MKFKLQIVILILSTSLFFGCQPSVEDGLTYDQYINKATQYRNAGDYGRAILAAKKAVTIKPIDGNTHYLLATLYDEVYRNSFEVAQKKRLQDLFMNPKKKHSKNLTEDYKRYGLKAEYKDFAIHEYQETVKYDPTNWGAHYFIATNYFNNKQFREAIVEYTEVIEINPKYVNAHGLRGKAYYELGDYPAAVENLEKAIGLDPMDEESYYDLGLAYRAMNNGEKVTEIMNKLKSMHSSYADKLRLAIFR